jgi:hypothetical protein
MEFSIQELLEICDFTEKSAHRQKKNNMLYIKNF